jgi:uncharacterized membrane protein YozB (DUF420 family)
MGRSSHLAIVRWGDRAIWAGLRPGRTSAVRKFASSQDRKILEVPVTVADLPTLNATLNGISAVLLGTGYAMIRTRRVAWHRLFMLSAWLTSMLFLASYTVYHAIVGSRPYHGPVRDVYFAILISHVVLAVVILPMAIMTLARALGGRFPAHARLARWTLPLWIYVSITGVVVYLMLYRL